jgi:hypothetical protein
MKWLLITTATRTPDRLDSNVGDEFARIGIQRVIREVDPQATFDCLDKEDPEQWEPRPFDKAVVCGMPLFSSLPSKVFPGIQNIQHVWWWPRIMRGWPSAIRENFLVWGVGHVFVDRIVSLLEYAAAIEEVLNRSWRLIVREPVLDHPKIVDSICPCAFLMMESKPSQREIPYCNLMPEGGHFGYLTPDGEDWKGRVQKIADVLKGRGFHFIAHTKTEAEFAVALGWPANRVVLPKTAAGYVDIYQKATCFFGNRLHGAALCAAAGIPTWGVSHDSRLGMVERLGGRATRCHVATPDSVTAWLDCLPANRPVPTPFTVAGEYEKMKKIVRTFSQELAKPPWTD